MKNATKLFFKYKKILISIGISLLALIILIAGAFVGTWHNEIFTVASIKELRKQNDAHMDGAVYRMNVKGGFFLDKFIRQGGVKSDQELISFITDNITKGLIDMGLSESEISCASFTARKPDGNVLFARNYDFSKTNTCIVFTEANNGRHASVSTIDMQFIGIDTDKGIKGLMDKITVLAAPYVPLDGMNDAGVSCGIYMTYQGEETVPTNQNTDKPDFTSTTLLRLILDYADNVDEAVEIAKSYDLHDSAKTSYHYMVADASGKSAILEWVGNTDISDNDGEKRKLIVTYNDNDTHIGEREGTSNFQWITNFIIQPGYYESDDVKPGYDRYEEIYNRLSATDGIVEDEWAAMNILAAVGRRNWKNDDKNGCTVHSVVYNLTEKTVLWVSNENYGDESAVFKFSMNKN